ncbi:hypothetical protein DAPPUDRAFT_111191 [Daphnia pulex]|uniref:Uncharacterized protein n=1 Tax=Daphnia pulex TaxID=6669 RepID=E9H8H0_DAPPU|nr:hypothetical protein DAPPUDRAFT_111191 [Daphnia pulex]|eukprot:EFX71944.1 hypothetical protein DAPPUDRAFT_111191 [Daphnia pulex]
MELLEEVGLELLEEVVLLRVLVEMVVVVEAGAAVKTNRQISSWPEWLHWLPRKDEKMARGFSIERLVSISIQDGVRTKDFSHDWTRKMVARVQQPGESVMQDAMAKEKLLAMAPVALTDQQKVQAFTEDLRSWQHQAAVMSTNPANVAALYTACNNLSTRLAKPEMETSSKSTDPVDPSAALEAVANRVKESVDMAPVAGRQADLVLVRQPDEDGAVEGRKQQRASDLFRRKTAKALTTGTTPEKISMISVRFGEVRMKVFDQIKVVVDSKVQLVEDQDSLKDEKEEKTLSAESPMCADVHGKER